MVWIVLAALGVPLWLCAAGIGALVVRNRALRKRAGDLPVRVLSPGKKRWARGHGIWVSDVFAWRSSPAGWKEDLLQVGSVDPRAPTDAEVRKIRRLENPVVVSLVPAAGGPETLVAASAVNRELLLGPFRTDGAQAAQPVTATPS